MFGYVEIYTRINFTNKTSVVASASFDFSKPITEELFSGISESYKKYYETEFDGYFVESIDFITKEEYEKENNTTKRVELNWNENDVTVDKFE
jgi:hypothetical protein